MDFKKPINLTVIPIQISFLGGLSAVIAELSTFPLDNIKTRIQMNGKEGLPEYKNTMDCVKKTFKLSGISGFYRGASAAIFRQITYSTVRIGCYEKLKRYFSADIDQVGFFRKFFAGGIAGGIGCIFGNPGDILKIRLINDLNNLKYKGFIDAAKQVLEKDGFDGFFKGLNVNLFRAIIINASELATYDQGKIFLVNKGGFDPSHLKTYFLASFMAGFVAALLSSPVDVIKTRYMNQMKSESKYKGIFDCTVDIFKNEGFFAFYKGFIPYFLRNGPWTIIFFIVYEKLKFEYVKLVL